MKKNNKKGFAIAEILAVSVAIMVIFVTVYSNFFPTTAEFERRIIYNDLESLYATYYMRQFYNGKFSDNDFNGRSYNIVYDGSKCTSSSNNNKCTKIANALGIKEMIITKNNIEELKQNINNASVSDELKKYVKYLSNHLTQTTVSEQYRVILKTESGYATSLLNYDKPVEPNKPTLTANLLPVKYESDGTIKVTSEEDKDWYDYDEANWANAVTIKEDYRSLYFDSNGKVIASDDTVVDSSHINTAWVWIPRYNYTIFNYNATGDTSVKIQKVEIHFENTTVPEGTIYCNDDTSQGTSEVCYYKDDSTTPIKIEENKNTYSYNGTTSNVNGATYTHPAFCFGSRTIDEETGIVTCNGTELAGIWVGKYENSLTDNNITILSGKSLYLGQSLADFYQKIKGMELYNNPYGFLQNSSATYSSDNERSNESIILNDNNDLDTHMMMNSEWGAVSYLTLSEYGIYNKKLSYKSGNSYLTVQTVAVNDTTTTGGGGDNSSTTNNNTGIYDMAGGTSELVMAGINREDATVDSLQLYYNGLSSIWTPNNSSRKYFSNFKYFDSYISNSSDSNVKIGKLGDATREVSKWLSGTKTLPTTGVKNPIFTRGGAYTDDTNILTYNGASGHGETGATVGSRSVLVIDPNGGNL